MTCLPVFAGPRRRVSHPVKAPSMLVARLGWVLAAESVRHVRQRVPATTTSPVRSPASPTGSGACSPRSTRPWERVLGPKVQHPAVLEALSRCGGPAGLRKTGRSKLAEIIRPVAPHLGARLVEQVFTALRAEGKKHNAALICLARRRVDVLHAMLRPATPYQVEPVEKLALAA